MGGAFDPIGATGDDRPLAGREVSGELARDVLAVGGRSPRAGDRHKVFDRAGQERSRAAHPQHVRRAIAQVIDRGWPLLISGHEHCEPALLDAAQPHRHVLQTCRNGQPIAPHLSVHPVEPRHRAVVVVVVDEP